MPRQKATSRCLQRLQARKRRAFARLKKLYEKLEANGAGSEAKTPSRTRKRGGVGQQRKHGEES
jgi:hypothetical protein